jgi:hypothetical protein
MIGRCYPRETAMPDQTTKPYHPIRFAEKFARLSE